jgi:hypothetical protein
MGVLEACLVVFGIVFIVKITFIDPLRRRVEALERRVGELGK